MIFFFSILFLFNFFSSFSFRFLFLLISTKTKIIGYSNSITSTKTKSWIWILNDLKLTLSFSYILLNYLLLQDFPCFVNSRVTSRHIRKLIPQAIGVFTSLLQLVTMKCRHTLHLLIDYVSGSSLSFIFSMFLFFVF